MYITKARKYHKQTGRMSKIRPLIVSVMWRRKWWLLLQVAGVVGADVVSGL